MKLDNALCVQPFNSDIYIEIMTAHCWFQFNFVTKPSYYISQDFLCPAVFLFRHFFLLHNFILKPSNDCQLEDLYPYTVICHTRSLFTNPCLLISKQNWATVIYKKNLTYFNIKYFKCFTVHHNLICLWGFFLIIGCCTMLNLNYFLFLYFITEVFPRKWNM